MKDAEPKLGLECLISAPDGQCHMKLEMNKVPPPFHFINSLLLEICSSFIDFCQSSLVELAPYYKLI